MDTSQDFADLCEACRKGDLRGIQEGIAKGVNINARDEFDYTPLILVGPPRDQFDFSLEAAGADIMTGCMEDIG